MFRVKALQVAAQRMITVTPVERVHCTQIVMRVGATALGKNFHTNTYMQVDTTSKVCAENIERYRQRLSERTVCRISCVTPSVGRGVGEPCECFASQLLSTNSEIPPEHPMCAEHDISRGEGNIKVG
jgi:hypothetical protein